MRTKNQFIHWLVKKCWNATIPGAGHLPSFFIPTLGHLDSFCVPIPGNLPNFFKKNANARKVSPGGGGGEGGGGWALLEMTEWQMRNSKKINGFRWKGSCTTVSSFLYKFKLLKTQLRVSTSMLLIT